jgi:hypothetical protein
MADARKHTHVQNSETRFGIRGAFAAKAFSFAKSVRLGHQTGIFGRFFIHFIG